MDEINKDSKVGEKPVVSKERKKIKQLYGIIAALVAMLFYSGFIIGFIINSIGVVYPIKYETSDDVVKEIQRLYNQKYVKGDYSQEAAIQNAIKGYVKGTGDKYGTYLTPEEAKDFNAETDNSLTGIGVEMNIRTENDKTVVTVADVFKDSPAEKAGIKKGSTVIKIDGKAVSDMDNKTVVNSVKGKEGTEVKLVVSLDGKETEFTIVRKEIQTTDIEYKILSNNVGYIKIKGFNVRTSKDFSEALKYMADNKVSKYVFDLRNNGGGLINAVMPMVDSIVPEGLIARTVDKNGKEQKYMSDKTEVTGSMVVLTNGHTASAAELFTLSLRDYNKATVVGEKTFGKGTELEVIQLKNGGLLALSTGLYYTKSSPNIEGKGITPDVEVKLSDELNEKLNMLSDKEDTQLAKALEILNK